MPTRSHMAAQQGRQHFQGRGQNIGQHGVVLPCASVGQTRVDQARGDAVVLGVIACGLHGSGVNVHRVNMRRAMQRRTNGENARATAVIQHALACHISRVLRHPLQAHARGGVGACAKCQARVERHHRFGLGRRLVPAGHYPKFGRDLHGFKLALRQAHPVLLGHGLHLQQLAIGKKVLRRQQTSGFACGRFGREQSFHAAALPALFGRGHARLTKQGLLGWGLRVGILHADRERIQRV